MIELNAWQMVLAVLGALFVGLGKGGLPGAGNITIWLYAIVFSEKASVGILLPVLICADVVAIAVYRKHAEWRYIGKLFPMTALGVGVGFFIFDTIDPAQMRFLIGGLLLGMTALHFARRWVLKRQNQTGEDPVPHTWWFVSATGLTGGIATMVANAAGPVAAFYLMAVKLPKYAFIGTSAWFFFLINVFKLPFQAAADNLSIVSLKLSLVLGIFAALGAAVAPKIVKFIPQKQFEVFVWIVIVFAGLNMIFG